MVPPMPSPTPPRLPHADTLAWMVERFEPMPLPIPLNALTWRCDCHEVYSDYLNEMSRSGANLVGKTTFLKLLRDTFGPHIEVKGHRGFEDKGIPPNAVFCGLRYKMP